MSDSLFTPNGVPPLPPGVPVLQPQPQQEEKRKLGRAVVNGQVRFLSVSQITKFDANEDGGCPRRWAFQYLFGKKESKTEALERGTEAAKQLEIYLKGGPDTLTPILRAGKHFLPKPGPDLEVEKPLGDDEKAIQLREAYLRSDNEAGRRLLANEIRRLARLTANNIPFIGAPDFRHRRGEFIDENGVLCREPHPLTLENGDHKTTSRVRDYTQPKNGKVLKGWAKTAEQVRDTPQMVGYGVAAVNTYPDLKWIRQSHIYYQTKNGYDAAKRTSVVPVEYVVRRWENHVEPVARELEQVARETDPDKIPFNLNACRAFNRDCDHAPYCNRPQTTIVDLFKTQGVDLDALVTTPTQQPTKGDSPMSSLFEQFSNGTPAAPTAPPAPAAPQITEEQRNAIIEAERARILAEMAQAQQTAVPAVVVPAAPTVPVVPAIPAAPVAAAPVDFGFCNKCGQKLAAENVSRLPSGELKHIGCAAAVATAPVVPAAPSFVAPAATPFVPSIASVNPPERPAPDLVASAAALPAEAIATIPDPHIRAAAEQHAADTAARAAQAASASGATEEKKGGRCPAGGTRVKLTQAQAATKKYPCPGCGKELKIRPSPDFTEATLSAHNIAKDETMPAPATPNALAAAVAAPAAMPIPVVPALPAAPPALPVAATPAPSIATIVPPLPSVPPTSAVPQLTQPVATVLPTLFTVGKVNLATGEITIDLTALATLDAMLAKVPR